MAGRPRTDTKPLGRLRVGGDVTNIGLCGFMVNRASLPRRASQRLFIASFCMVLRVAEY